MPRTSVHEQPPGSWSSDSSDERPLLEPYFELAPAPKTRRAVSPKSRVEEIPVTPFRPVRRPSMALLCLIDDGKEEGEWFRLREDRIVLGRAEGDIRIPHDSMMSAKHAELTRQLEQGCFRWYLVDLQSTNGTFVRIGDALIRHNQEILIGSRCYRFDAAPQGSAEAAAASEPASLDKPKSTRGWTSVSAGSLMPSLVEKTPQGDGQRFALSGKETFVGRDSRACNVVIEDDPFVSPQHARLYRNSKGLWRVQNTHSHNGLWLRIDRMPIDAGCHFQLGEQRFLFRVL